MVTARSSETGARTDQRSEALEDTAREVDLAGGRGHHYLCDHTREGEVDAMVRWVLRRFGRIDVAVSSVWGGNEGYDGVRYPDGAAWGTAFWRRGLAPLRHGMETGPLAGLLLARAVAPAMVSAKGGLLALVSFGTEAYLGDLFYDLAKFATNRLAPRDGRGAAPTHPHPPRPSAPGGAGGRRAASGEPACRPAARPLAGDPRRGRRRARRPRGRLRPSPTGRQPAPGAGGRAAQPRQYVARKAAVSRATPELAAQPAGAPSGRMPRAASAAPLRRPHRPTPTSPAQVRRHADVAPTGAGREVLTKSADVGPGQLQARRFCASSRRQVSMITFSSRPRQAARTAAMSSRTAAWSPAFRAPSAITMSISAAPRATAPAASAALSCGITVPRGKPTTEQGATALPARISAASPTWTD